MKLFSKSEKYLSDKILYYIVQQVSCPCRWTQFKCSWDDEK